MAIVKHTQVLVILYQRGDNIGNYSELTQNFSRRNMHLINSDAPRFLTPPITRKYRASPVDHLLRPKIIFDDIRNEQEKDVEADKQCQSSISEDEGLELSGDFPSDTCDSSHDCVQECCRRVIVNVSGLRFETQLKTLNRLPKTLLGDPERRNTHWDPRRKEYFFDRHRPSFQAILYYYQSGGRLNCPYEVPLDVFIAELEFFDIAKDVIEKYKVSQGIIPEGQRPLPTKNTMKVIWQLFEYPDSSFAAKVLALVSVAFILVSIATFCLETIPELSVPSCINTTNQSSNDSTDERPMLNYNSHFFILESTCALWFIFELVMRFVSCPCKLKFFKSFITWIDILSVVPNVLFVVVYWFSGVCIDGSTSEALAVLRIMRITRVFKLSKHSEGLRIFGETMAVSMRELSMFSLFLGFGVVIFSAAVYYSEQSLPDSHFSSIPNAFWWSIVTMTTVGYGDMFPISVIGKLVGTLAVISGILTIGLPVPIIVNNFTSLYNAAKGRKSMF